MIIALDFNVSTAITIIISGMGITITLNIENRTLTTKVRFVEIFE
ncbi:hypothetical protein ACKW6Q_05140 [Chryseobacterium kwangjuense]|uniref:Uncharacterized protein n=1 Tax=Chryseobacterium kwangjuense TaxID=267125 RepID=A0ABW9K1K6_9FLAO